MPIICEGCGQRVSIPEGYRRNKIQCACGIICAVPETERQITDAPTPKKTAATAKKKPAVEQQAERRLLDEDEPTREKPSQPSSKQEPVWWPSVDEPDGKEENETEDEDDSSPYGVEGADEVRCPKCSFMLPPASVLCIRCGFHLKKRKKIVKIYQPIDRAWETNAGYQTRLLIFWSCIAAFLGVGLAGVIQGEAPLGVFLFTFVFVTAILAFLFGSFARIQLTRNPRGRVQLTKTWRMAFFARPPQTLDVRGYEGIVGGRHREIGSWENMICFLLLGLGVIPGILWWYFVIHKVTFHVSLSQDHGFPAYLVYSGWSEMQMKEIAYTLRDATGLRYDEG